MIELKVDDEISLAELAEALSRAGVVLVIKNDGLWAEKLYSKKPPPNNVLQFPGT